MTTWTAVVPLVPGANALAITATDLNGNIISNYTDTITITSTGPEVSPVGNVVINEIHYNPLVPDTAFVELFNTSTNTFDLSGWRLDGVDFDFPPGSVITNRQFLTIAATAMPSDTTSARARWWRATLTRRLDNDGEVLSLLKPLGTNTPPLVVDRVRYEAAAPWATNANGTGPSLQLIDASADNARVSNWGDGSGWRFFSLTTNIGGSRLSFLFSDSVGGDVYLDDLSLVPGAVPGVGVNALANGNFESPLSGAWTVAGVATNSHLTNGLARSGSSSLHFVQSAGAASLTAFFQDANPPVATNTTYTLSGWYLPGVGPSTSLVLRAGTSLQARPNLRPVAPTPGAVNLTAAPVPAYPTLWLNEALPQNTSGVTDGAGDRDPWIELHNAGPDAVSLDGMFLSDGYVNLAQWAFPSGLSIAPGGFLVVWCDGEPGESTPTELHTNFRLTAGTGSIALSRTVGGAPQILDYLNYAGIRANESYGSVPDGQPFYRGAMFYPTPGATNDRRSAPHRCVHQRMDGGQQRARAVLADPADGNYEDWFELFNPGPGAVDLGGSFLTDNLANPLPVRDPGQRSLRHPARRPSPGVGRWRDRPELDQPCRPARQLQLARGGRSHRPFRRRRQTLIDAVTFTNQLDNVSMGRSPRR